MRFALELRVVLSGDNPASVREWLTKAGAEAKLANSGSAGMQEVSDRIRASVPSIAGRALFQAMGGADSPLATALAQGSGVLNAFEGYAQENAAGHLMNGVPGAIVGGKLFNNALGWGWSKLPSSWQTRLNPANYQLYLRPGLGSNFGNVGVKLKALPESVGMQTKTVLHHIFNKFRGNSTKSQTYRDFFRKHGIDVDQYTVEISEDLHRKMIHGRGQNWTSEWKAWIDANPNASTMEVYHQAGMMMAKYGIDRKPIVPYR